MPRGYDTVERERRRSPLNANHWTDTVNRTRVILVLVGATAALSGCTIVRWLLPESQSLRRSRGTVHEILFVESDRVLIRNELGELFSSDLSARTWSKLSGRAFGLTSAGGREIWGAIGWPGHHECPGGSVWYSADAGKTWLTSQIEVPCDHDSEVVYARLPRAFVNAPSEDPLLLMFNLQLMRPMPGREVDSWRPVGRPVPAVDPRLGRTASGVQFRGVIYIAASDQIFMSQDEGQTWTADRVHPFTHSEVRCHTDRCFALLRDGSEWNALLSAAHRTNDWQLVAKIDHKSLSRILADESKDFGGIDTFVATSLLVDEHGVNVAGVINGGRASSWGAVVSVADDGTLQPLKGGLPHAVWALSRAPDHTLWAAGMGVHKRVNDRWMTVWPDPKPEALARPGP